MNIRRKALAILLTMIIAVTVGVVVFLQLTEKSTISITPASAVVEPPAPGYIGNSSIYLVSTSSFYGPYPFASAVGPPPGSTPVIKEGNPCFIINATIRNDYTLENLPPNQVTLYYSNGTAESKSAHVYAFLTAKIYDKQGNVIQATDVTPPYGFWNGGAYASLGSGQNETLTMYFATSQKNVDHFEIVLRYVGSLPPP
jgi:hypothetical protein